VSLKGSLLPIEDTKRKRIAHIIKRSTRVRLPKDFIFYDTETATVDNKGTQKMKLAYACHWHVNLDSGTEKTDWFDTVNEVHLFDWLASRCRRSNPMRLLSANIWFDLRVSGVLHQFQLRRWTCERFFTRGHTFIAIFVKDRYKIVCLNIQNYFNFPVVAIGESIGLPKLDINLDHASEGNLRKYCKRDVEIIYSAFRSFYNFIKDNKLGNIGYTLPSTAYSCYVHSFIPYPIRVHAEEKVLALERSAYFGGRCECYWIGTFNGQRFYKLDVNAMYPFVMRNNEYPVEFKKAGYNVSLGIVKKFSDRYCYVAEVIVNTKLPIYALRDNGKVLFTVGTFKTYLTTPSLLYAIEHGHVVRINKLALYKKANVFKEFVDHFYDKRLEYREEGNAAFAYVCKIMLNSLYGKFGQKVSVTVYEGEVENGINERRLVYHLQEKRSYIHQTFFGLEQIIILKEEEGMNSVPSLCAHVTDYARLYLWQLIEKAGIKNCYYCDTDSLIVNEKGFKALSSYTGKDELGKLRIEDVTDSMVIRGCKNYIFGSVERIKGVKPKHKKLPDGKYEYLYFPTPISELRRGLKEDYRISTCTKVLTGRYDKGRVLKSGQVKPFTFTL
jgi:hypothetical protein